MAIFVLSSNLSRAVSQLSPVTRKVLTSQGKTQFPVSRWICGKNFRDPEAKRIPPFPYKEKKYTMIRSWFDRTTNRFDENSKIIVVDGAVGAGKSAFAKELAEDLDMYYMEEADMDMIYINQYGYDMRKLDPKLPKDIRSYDTRNFCLDPHHRSAAFLQCMLYQLKFSKYVDALAHLMNTGNDFRRRIQISLLVRQIKILSITIFSKLIFPLPMHKIKLILTFK